MTTGKSNINLEEVPISDQVRGEMSLTVSDQQFIKRALDLQCDAWNDAFDVNIKELTAALAEVIAPISVVLERLEKGLADLNIEMKELRSEVRELKISIKEINTDLISIKSTIKEHGFRISLLEKHLGL
jgi:hypothetical protein